MMNLKRFRVTNFRSIDDSGWIETDDVTALIGTNESGKTNVLLPLWKFNPAKEGEIVPTADYPRKHYTSLRHENSWPVFIRTVFEVDDKLAAALADETNTPTDAVRTVEVAKSFDNKFHVDFPNAKPVRSVAKSRVLEVLQRAACEIAVMTALKTEKKIKERTESSLRKAKELVTADDLGAEDLTSLLTTLDQVKPVSAPKTGGIMPRYRQAARHIQALRREITRGHPRNVDGAVELVLENLPKFVYYSTYGNLDSEIYLPHVIQNLAREDLGAREQAKARTLKVLFEFVGLKPDEILDLGQDFPNRNREPTDSEIANIAEKKKQRSILLQSASTLLTTRFRNWWKQGEYRFRFEADGNHFRIWVSDDKRPEEVELEGRSTGLQWFLSFYLVFLVEHADAHDDAILLLDEPGLSLHPLAQRGLVGVL